MTEYSFLPSLFTATCFNFNTTNVYFLSVSSQPRLRRGLATLSRFPDESFSSREFSSLRVTELSYIRRHSPCLSIRAIRFGALITCFRLPLFFENMYFLLFAVKVSCRGRISRNHFQRSRRQLEFSNLDRRTLCRILFNLVQGNTVPSDPGYRLGPASKSYGNSR